MTRILFAMLLIVLAPAAVNAACRGRIVSVGSPAALIYDPFAPGDATQPFTITIQNTGPQSCAYQLAIPPASYPLQFASKLSYAITQAGATVTTAPMFTAATPILKPQQTFAINAVLIAFRGQALQASLLTGTVTFVLNEAAAPSSPLPLDQARVSWTCTIPAVVGINVAGGGQKVTIDLRQTGPGNTATVILQTRATTPYSLAFMSHNRGVLAPVIAQDSAQSVPYAISVDSQSVNLAAIPAFTVQTAPGETTHRITITLGDTSNALAGVYRDVIVIKITSVL